MKTKSYWGNPPSRIYSFLNKVKEEIPFDAKICIVGASDGKFVFPFLRMGYDVTAYDLDSIALYGGEKIFPIERDRVQIEKQKYIYSSKPPVYSSQPIKIKYIDGLYNRAKKEGLLDRLHIKQKDFYRQNISEKFDVVFTSCSIPYECNLDLPVKNIISTLQFCVKNSGYLYMDYLMPLDDRHEWKPEHYFRSGQIKRFFEDGNWDVLYNYEQKQPVFEAAHIDRPEDHFHRFGYILAKKVELSL